MEQKRVLELALESLNRKKAGIDEEIETLRNELDGTGTAIRQTPSLPSTGTRRGRTRTPAQRKAQAQRMREIWKKRKAAAAVKTAPAAASRKTRSMTDARKKALSLKMKAVWKKRKAAAKKVQAK